MRVVMILAAVMPFATGCGKKTAQNTDTGKGTPAPTPTVVPTQRTSGSPTPGTPGKNTNYAAGAGTGQNVRSAARRADALNEMKNLGQAIEQLRDPFGKMPDKDTIVADLKSNPKLQTAVADGSFILTGTTDAAGLWAYEVEADTRGGIVLVGGVARRATAAETKQLLAPVAGK